MAFDAQGKLVRSKGRLCNLEPKFEGNNKDTVAFLSLEMYQKFTFVSRGRDGKLSLDSSGFGKGIMDITP